jgi:superfamily II DNA or RNA helicase
MFGDMRLVRSLWPHQERSLAALDPGNSATYVVVPPGGGKTLIGPKTIMAAGIKETRELESDNTC